MNPGLTEQQKFLQIKYHQSPQTNSFGLAINFTFQEQGFGCE